MCRMDLNLLQDYIDGSIGSLEKLVLEEHLRVCPDCRKELNRLKLLDWDLKNYFVEEAAIPVPDELAVLREASLSLFLGQEKAAAARTAGDDTGGVGFKDMVSLQVSTLQHSLKFVSLLTGLNRAEKPVPKTSKKKKSLLRKIIGM